MDLLSFSEYNEARDALVAAERRVKDLRDAIQRFEAQRSGAVAASAIRKSSAAKVPYNLQAVYEILRRHAGPMRLRDIAAEHDLTTAGTRAQLLALIDHHLAELVDRGVYRAL